MKMIALSKVNTSDPLKRRESGAANMEAAIGLPFIIFLFIVLTELGFYIMARHSLDLSAGVAAESGAVLPLGNGDWAIGPVPASNGPCNQNNVLTPFQARNQLLCMAGVIARNHSNSQQLISSESLEVSAAMTSKPGAIDGPRVRRLSVTVSANHRWFFGFFGATTPVQGTKTVRYVFAPY